MALPDEFNVQNLTAKVITNSGGDAAITLASLANGSARQAVKLDLGTPRAEVYKVWATFELAATPTAGNIIEVRWAPSRSGTAGTDNFGNTTGADAAYTGYSSNLEDAIKQLDLVGAFHCTADATTTVQKGLIAGRWSPANRYGNLVIINRAGSAFHSTETNQAIYLEPIEGVVVD